MAASATTPCSNSCCTTMSTLLSTGCSPSPSGSFSGLRMKKTTDCSLSLLFQNPRHVDLPSNARISCRCDASVKTKPMTTSSSAGKEETKLSIVFVSAEVSPWSKTGGLGDVISGLPPAIAAFGHRVMTIAPRYDQYRDAWDTELLADVTVGERIEKVRFFHSYERGVDRVFVDHPCFLEKVWGVSGSKLYGAETGSDYLDNQFRFALFNHAAIEAPLRMNLPKGVFNGPYGQDVIFVANDWHSALVPLYLKANYKPRGLFLNAKVAICIHNIAYQGRFAFQDFYQLSLPDCFKSSFDFMDGYDKPVKGRKINWLKAGLLESDIVLTVSPNYASELVSGEDRGVELDSILRKTGITGIINGMDVEEWDPSSDKFLDVNYDAETVFDAKPSLKEALQAEVGLPINPDVPVFGFIGRLEEQKGSDILAEAITQIIEHDIQLIVLGTGKTYLEKQLRDLELRYPKKARGIVKFNAALGHMIIAGADFMLVPSRFEPCGLIQLFSMRYGSIPIVASTGGLVDTVIDGVTGLQIGKSFNVKCEEIDPIDVEALATTVKRAIKIYKTKEFYQMVETCMSQDLSWKGPAKQWEEMLVSLATEQCEKDEDPNEFEEENTRQCVVMAA